MVFQNKVLTEISAKSPLVLIDGTCVVCNGFANFVINNDKRKQFYFAAIQSDTGKKIVEALNLDAIDSIILIHQNQTFIYSSAIAYICKFLGKPWSLLYYCSYIFPDWFKDKLYIFFAKNRFLLGQKNDSCFIPSPDLNNRILK